MTNHIIRGLREGALIIFGTIAVYLSASLVTFDPNDPGWSHSQSAAAASNAGGVAGAWFSDIFLYLFGYMAYLFPLLIAYTGWLLFKGRKTADSIDIPMSVFRAVGFVLTLSAGTGLSALHFVEAQNLPLNAGGVLGNVVGQGLVDNFNFLGGTLFLTALLLTGITLLTSLSWIRLIDNTGRITLRAMAWVFSFGGRLRERREQREAKLERVEYIAIESRKSAKRIAPTITEKVQSVDISDRIYREQQVPLFKSDGDGSLPSLSLLDPPEPPKNNVSKESLEAMSRLVELKLKDFGVQVNVVAVHPGPVVTSYELMPAAGVKVSQITNLAKDLARSLSAISVRVVEIIPGKSTIGLEIPNEEREIVRLCEVLQSKQFDNAKSPLTIALGKDISGRSQVADLGKMPHLLVAGTTGSGKSVGLNAMVLSILYNSTPDQVRLIMIDPKMLELSVYEGIPHLLAPVVTDMKQAANALRWGINEMERRYQLMSHMGVRNLAGYNKKIAEAEKSGEQLKDPFKKPDPLDPEETVYFLSHLPNIVIVIDELADMMMVVGKKMDELIARLAQKARAAGVHLILATQRPSVDVLTGLIKANIPTRIAFQVSAKVDSRTILDQGGAEQLLGHGDMLYLAPGTGIPLRVHGAFVSDHEVHRVVADLKERGAPQYIDEVLDGPSNSGSEIPGMGSGGEELDEHYDTAVRIVTETRRASVSSIQRRLKIGYNRAARIVEQMELDGVVGPPQTNGMREVIAQAPPPDH
ncbi:MAG: DNA translocase FtsK [Thiohalomonadales bacterium]